MFGNTAFIHTVGLDTCQTWHGGRFYGFLSVAVTLDNLYTESLETIQALLFWYSFVSVRPQLGKWCNLELSQSDIISTQMSVLLYI